MCAFWRHMGHLVPDRCETRAREGTQGREGGTPGTPYHGSMQEDQPGPPVPTVEFCYRHPGEETRVHCTRCERPICPACMIPAPVGHQCPECVAQARREFRQGPARRMRTLGGVSATRGLLVAILAMYIVEVLAGGPVRMDVSRHEVTVRGEPAALPPKEFELLETFLRRKGRLLTRDFLIEEVWGPSYFGDTKTLDVHVKRLRRKIEENPHRPVNLVTVRGLGYKFVD